MKIKYLKLKSWLLASLGGLLGLSSCCCMYGTPEATYHLNGVVTNKDGDPIEGIGVGSYRDWDAESDTAIKYNAITDAQGRYNITFGYYMPGETISLDYCDIDGEQNGRYKDTIVSIPTSGVQLTGGRGAWYEGEGTIVQNVTLTEITDK